MKFTITDKRLEITEDLKQYAEKKVGKIDRLFRTESEAFITFGRERGRYTAEVTLKNNGMYTSLYQLQFRESEKLAN